MANTKPNAGKRVFFTKDDTALPLPNLIAHQKDSWREFVETGLSEIFSELNPIEDYTGQKLELRFKEYAFQDPKVTEVDTKENNLTFDAPLHVNVELTNKVTGEVKEQEIYLGDYPWMTDRGTFIINGTERVVVSQLIRSSGVFFTADSAAGRNNYGAKLIPGRGAWLEFETASNGAIFVKIDRRRKLPVTTLLRALGHNKTSEIKSIFEDVDTGDVKYIDATLEKDPARGSNEALIEVYRRLRPGDLATVENARGMIEKMFFDFKRFDYSRVGRYKLNQRLNLEVANTTENRVFQMSDLIAIIKEIIRLNNTQELPDDIDALSNRRVKLVGELVARQFRVGMLRMQRNAMDRMSMSDLENVTPGQLINARPVVAAVREFFASSQLSQLMDGTNPLAELSHKRRLSSMGPGGLSRERAGFDVRDAHPTHYGRLCSVETPEGANIGLVLNLATYARVNEYGFIETPYLKVKDSKVTDEIVYLDASQEIVEVIADAGAALNDDGSFAAERVSARNGLLPEQVDASEVTYLDAAHKQILGSTASLVPFIEKNRVDRSLTGSNMQRQAVPLITPESPTVGTGIEAEVARNTSQLVVAEGDGEVVRADADEVHVKYSDGVKIYEPIHFTKSNDDRSINQKVCVTRGQKVKAGDILIEGASVADGELALGRDLTVAFMPWGGYNMDDAIVLSDRIVKEDALTSINIKDYNVEVRETKLGPEIVTRDIPNVSEESLRHLDENGIVQIGSEVKAGDVLVGKITPKGEQELSSEERLLRAIFGEKAKDVRDTSQRMNNAGGGKVVGVKIFSRENGHELKAGVLMQIQIFVAQLRKISVGDKLAGRHGNKGVVARILPIEDMPFMEDGTPVDVVLNPLGVPSRMNIGQLFETHLGMAARALGYKVATPPFNGVTDETISSELEKAGYARDGKSQLFDGRTGEPFEERTTVGVMHIIKLHHMVSDKIHARSTGPYTMVTQQPLGGKAQNGGQRFGEMEVWALEAYGAATTLQEMLTIKSDDVYGRAKAYESIIKNEAIVGPKLPESFNVLVKELQGLGLRVDLLDESEDAVIDAEEIIAESGPADKSVPMVPSSDDEETVLDEADEFGDIEDGMSIQDIDEVEEIKEEV
ncbi:TPA: DNA-directed RNA polymerase subunit beta [Candidatus Saccharibacteria bacterium]|nr:MAG: DNA-directed RNA polymerase subunit beta [Candidatus Saccharibacteria bacterium GW2011_GWC2_44_17]MBH1956219.1 DNA-directed RNA polymerase subunit beta [Candidatus Saccharibacteria bacterium]OGL23732.1 MAG: DNA-directed RNA polymerase subunit beta [Candidatus Saccharibacteria bacterium RIFCSPHIGHO2_01_FULL_46_30]OGL34045.1 MAG: DNA-directed RNA polymerase subunit beta [Candidatus Saccharibacteria bacterium RIFCSPHIGHO2_12_FULL_47_16]MBH1972607.1 DNA-directed RNA polymerase subunit beta 